MSQTKKKYLIQMLIILNIIVFAFVIYSVYPQIISNNSERYKNHLTDEKSPYLLQHANNPVDWYPWGEEAFEKANKEDKPIFLSIGYSTCHWCHVMEEESFEDTAVAYLMNDAFVCIKVDREERPDIDNIYMTVCQLLTGSGGWPLTIIMTPDKRPFFAGTYFPKESRFGKQGLMEMIPQIKNAWETQKDKILKSAGEIILLLEEYSGDAKGETLNESSLKRAYDQLTERYDEQYGGFGTAPKFPTPHNLLYLLRYWKRTGDNKALEMVEKTLTTMRRGGIYDHIGYGFHRYSTDFQWLLPHFEKMLYDQALIAMVYTEAYLATENDKYKKTTEEIFAYVIRDMTSPQGGFYTAEDGASEGEEGKFYLWSEVELRNILGVEDAETFVKIFNVETLGNFLEQSSGKRTGTNILYLKKSLEEISKDLKITVQELDKFVSSSREKLFTLRKKKVRPRKDDKILTDWNGLMISALSKGSQAFNESKYEEKARKAADFILNKMRTKEGRLLHRYRSGHAGLQANIDDYAFLIAGLLDLYETNFDVEYLKAALELNNQAIDYFWDSDNGGFYFTANDSEELLVRKKEFYDGAVPSGNSVAMLNLLRIGRITANSKFEDMASQLMNSFSKNIKSNPSQYTNLMNALDFGIGPSFEIIVSGNSAADDTRKMLIALRKEYVPNKVVILRPNEEKSPEILNISEFTKDQLTIDNKATVYVCVNYACNFPTTDVNKMIELLNKK
jgi:uncharacterized protein YyaL (SSP411 family)